MFFKCYLKSWYVYVYQNSYIIFLWFKSRYIIHFIDNRYMHNPVQLSATSLISHQPALHAYSVYNITLAIRISVMLSTNFIWWMLDYRDQGCKYITYIAYFCVVYKRVCISFGLGGGGGRALSPIDLLPVWNESAWRVWSMHTISQT